ncbi:MAG: type II secretion system F family protein [Isosphaeraceae bacterium]
MSEPSGSHGAGGSLSGPESAALSGHVAGLTRASLPIASGLAALAEELPRGRLRRSMNDLANRLESGMSLAEAIDDQDGWIPPHLRGLVIAGARSHRLGDVLGQFSGYVGIGAELRRRLWLTLAYPFLSMAIALTIFTFVSILIVPQFEKIFRDFGMPLPRATTAILEVSYAMQSLGPSLFVLVAVAIVFRIVSPAFLHPGTLRAMAGGLPIIGGVWRWTSLSEFCHLLGLLLANRLPLPEALRLTGQGVEDAAVERACLRMAESVESGHSLARAMSELRLFPAGLPRLVYWGTRQRSLPEVLDMAAAMFESRAAAQASLAGTVLSVLAICLVLWGLLTVVLGLMLPLVSLISRLSG